MLLTEYNEAETMEMFREEGRAEGALNAMLSLVRDGFLSVSIAASQAKLSEEAFRRLLEGGRHELPG